MPTQKPSLNQKLAPLQVTQHAALMPMVYRLLKKDTYAKQFARGYVRVSTLETCRRAEAAGMGDTEEGVILNYLRKLSLDGDDPQTQRWMSAPFAPQPLKIAKGVRHIVFDGITIRTGIKDAYVLCLTEAPTPVDMQSTFGDHKISISNPAAAFQLLTESLEKMVELHSAWMGQVSYIGRKVYNFESANVHPGFLKPARVGDVIYENQREIRMLWVPKEVIQPLKPLELYAPALSRLCTYERLVPRSPSGEVP